MAATRSGPRAPRLSAAVTRRLCDFLRTGATDRAAARAAGIHPKTFHTWLRRGERALAQLAAGEATGAEVTLPKAERPYAKLVEEVAEAEAQFEVAAAGMMLQGARGGAVVEERTLRRRDGSTLHVVRRAAPDWRAALALLRARRPEDWSERSHLELSGSVEGGGMSGDEARERLLEMIQRIQGSVEHPPHDRNGGQASPDGGGPTTTEES